MAIKLAIIDIHTVLRAVVFSPAQAVQEYGTMNPRTARTNTVIEPVSGAHAALRQLQEAGWAIIFIASMPRHIPDEFVMPQLRVHGLDVQTELLIQPGLHTDTFAWKKATAIELATRADPTELLVVDAEHVELMVEAIRAQPLSSLPHLRTLYLYRSLYAMLTGLHKKAWKDWPVLPHQHEIKRDERPEQDIIEKFGEL